MKSMQAYTFALETTFSAESYHDTAYAVKDPCTFHIC